MANRNASAVLFITVFIDLLGFGIIIPILPIYATELGASPLVVGVIAGVYSLMNFLFSPFWGSLGDRFGRRPIMLISIAITAVAFLSFAYANTILLLILSRILAGIGSANISTAQAYITDITPPEGRAKALGMIGAAFGLGFIFGPPAGGFVKEHYGIEWVGFMAMGLSLINLVMAFFMLPETLKVRSTETHFNFRPVTSLIRAMRRFNIRQLFTINFIFITAFSLMQITVALLWKEHYDLDEDEIGYMFAYMGLSTALVQGFLVGLLARKFGERKLLSYGAVMMGLGLLSIPMVPEKYFFLQFFSLSLIAVANGCLTPSLASLISRSSATSEQGKMLGLNQSFASLSRVIGPVSGGMLYGIHYVLPYVGSFLLMMVTLWLSLLVKKPETIEKVSEE